MNPNYKFNLETQPEPGDMDIIFYGLQDFNSRNTGGSKPEYLVITVRNRDGIVVGGLVGKTYVEWLYVQALWVPEDLRGYGHGTALLSDAEKEARRRGCRNSWLDTFSFQALPFYQKLGYKIFAELSDFPPGGSKFFLMKSLET